MTIQQFTNLETGVLELRCPVRCGWRYSVAQMVNILPSDDAKHYTRQVEELVWRHVREEHGLIPVPEHEQELFEQMNRARDQGFAKGRAAGVNEGRRQVIQMFAEALGGTDFMDLFHKVALEEQ